MNRALAFLPAWWLLQIPNPALWKDGLGIGMVVLIVWLWERDRKGRVKAQTESDRRYTVVVNELMELNKRSHVIIEGNTRAVTTLGERLTGNITNCPVVNDPVISAWMKAFAENSLEEQKRKRRSDA